MRLKGGLPCQGKPDSQGGEFPSGQQSQPMNFEERVTRYGPHRGGMVGCWTGIRRGDVVALDAKCKTKAEKALLKAYLPDALFFRHHMDWFVLGIAGGLTILLIPLLLEHKFTTVQVLSTVWR
jgi:hypothetical protein